MELPGLVQRFQRIGREEEEPGNPAFDWGVAASNH